MLYCVADVLNPTLVYISEARTGTHFHGMENRKIGEVIAKINH